MHHQLLTLLHDNRYKEAATEFSARYAQYCVADTATHIAAHVLNDR